MTYYTPPHHHHHYHANMYTAPYGDHEVNVCTSHFQGPCKIPESN